MKVCIDQFERDYAYQSLPPLFLKTTFNRIHAILHHLNLNVNEVSCKNEQDITLLKVYLYIFIDFKNEEDAALFLLYYKGTECFGQNDTDQQQ